jgi:hypothetical protein
LQQQHIELFEWQKLQSFIYQTMEHFNGLLVPNDTNHLPTIIEQAFSS